MLYGERRSKYRSSTCDFVPYGWKKLSISRASTYSMGQKESKKSFPEFLVQAHKKSKTKKSKNSIIVHQICCHAFLEEQSWCSMGSSSFLFQHVYPIRLLEAAELLEADQRKHEGGQSKETSFSNWLSGVVPRRQCIYCLMCTTSSQYSLLQPKTSTKFDGILHDIEKQKNRQVFWQTSPKSKQTHIYGRGQTYNICFRSEKIKVQN